jgi:hypothetical protein
LPYLCSVKQKQIIIIKNKNKMKTTTTNTNTKTNYAEVITNIIYIAGFLTMFGFTIKTIIENL